MLVLMSLVLCLSHKCEPGLNFPLNLLTRFACKYLIFFPISDLVAMKQPNNSLHLPYPTRDTHKIANKVMTVASSQINWQSKQDLICHVAKVKATTSAHSMAT